MQLVSALTPTEQSSATRYQYARRAGQLYVISISGSVGTNAGFSRFPPGPSSQWHPYDD